MLTRTENIAPFKFRVFRNEVKQLPPAAAKLILYGARDMTKKKFYLDGISKYLQYLKKCFFIEKALYKFTTAKTYSQPTCLVATSRRSLQMLELEKQMRICFVSITLFNLPFLLKRRINFVSLSPLKAFLDQIFLQQMNSVCPSLSDDFAIEKYLARNNFTSFIYDTPTTINNLLAYYFRKQGKKVIYLQHGIYQLSNYKIDAATKSLATGYVVWGEAFKQLFIDNGIHKSIIRVGCINKPVKPAASIVKSKTVCFFGLPLTKFNDEVCEEMLESISKVNSACEEYGYRLIYKPHPMENVEDTKQRFKTANIQVPILSQKLTMHSTLNAHNMFVGFYSTTLIEAGIQNKKALQILMHSKSYDDFGKLGICKSVRSDAMNFSHVIKELIEEKTIALRPDSYYIRHTENPGLRYKQCIESLIHETPTIISNDELYA
jgi:hypothetical protein